MKKLFLSLFLFVSLVTTAICDNDILKISNPSSADFADTENYLIIHNTYYISYSKSKLIPNWVGWHVNLSDLSTGRHEGTFIIDKSLPKTWIRVTHKDYDNTGFDRGHLCPNADRNAHDNGKETFITTNIVPQTAECNRGVWKALEDYCRQLIEKNGNELYVFAGVYGESGTISNKNIIVPEYCWKVVLILPEGEDDLVRINEDTVTIAVWIPNSHTCNNVELQGYAVTIDYIEEKTRYNFFENTPEKVQLVIETRKYQFNK